MAEKSGEASPSDASTPQSEERESGNWWDSWLSSAKTKSAEVYSMVKKDLDEIGSAVKSEATHVFSTTSNVIGKTLKLDVPESPANVMKKSLSTFIGQVSTVLNPEPDDDDDTEIILSSGDTTMLTTYKKELEALQRLDATFIVPTNSPEFTAWLASLENADNAVISHSCAVRRLGASPYCNRSMISWCPMLCRIRNSGNVNADKAVISHSCAVRRLGASPLLQSQYDKLVPDAVSHTEFWERYLFRVALLQDRLAAASRKPPTEPPTDDPVLKHLPLQTPIQQSPKKVLSEVESETPSPYESPEVEVDDGVTWENEDFANELELTEEQQTLLLEEYEREITSKKQKQPRTTDNAQRDKLNNKIIDKKNKSPKKKADDCGNNIVEDYFGEKEVKDDASANSDESWEKEFEIDDVDTKA